jgi:membrane protein implicated in regulation of membrane protease activity
LFVAIVFAGWYLYRKFVSDAIKLAKASERKRKEQQTGAVGTLVQDPVTGEYRVRRPEE